MCIRGARGCFANYKVRALRVLRLEERLYSDGRSFLASLLNGIDSDTTSSALDRDILEDERRDEDDTLEEERPNRDKDVRSEASFLSGAT